MEENRKKEKECQDVGTIIHSKQDGSERYLQKGPFETLTVGGLEANLLYLGDLPSRQQKSFETENCVISIGRIYTVCISTPLAFFSLSFIILFQYIRQKGKYYVYQINILSLSYILVLYYPSKFILTRHQCPDYIKNYNSLEHGFGDVIRHSEETGKTISN